MESSYFLGANTPDGFYSLFSELYNPNDNWDMYIIKSGPGTGKSTLMKTIAAEAVKKNLSVDLIPCSSDPKSLDGIIIPEIKISVCDGTSPHIVEPIYPGVCEHIINLSDCWDKSRLKNNEAKIKIMTMTNKKAHQKCVKYLRTAKIFENEINKIIYPLIKFEKIERFTERISEIRYKQTGEPIIKTRLLSSLSPIGITINYDTFLNESKNIMIIKDNYNISQYLLNSILKKNDKNIIKYMCPMDPSNKIDHLFFTDIKFGIFTSNKYHSLKNKSYKTISTDRFLDTDELQNYIKSITFLNKNKYEMINEAIASLQTAKSTHDLLESYYIEAMDFNKVNLITQDIINQIFHNI